MHKFIGKLLAILALSCTGNAYAALISYDMTASINLDPASIDPVFTLFEGGFVADDTAVGAITGFELSSVDDGSIFPAGSTITGSSSTFDPSTLALQMSIVVELENGWGVGYDFGDGNYPRPANEVAGNWIPGGGSSPVQDPYSGFDLAFVGTFSITPGEASVPVPASFALVGIGLAGVGWSKRKRE